MPNMCSNVIHRFTSGHKLWFSLHNQISLKTCNQLMTKKSNLCPNYYHIRCLNHNSYDWMQSRGILKSHFPEKEDINELLSSKRTIYAGFDATYDSLHVGNLLVLISLLHLQRLGHRVIVLIGDSTARIGDPSGKTEDRPLIETEVVMSYATSIEKSVKRIFENHKKYFWKTKGRNDRLEDFMICRNSEWYSDKNVIDFMSSFGRYLRVTTMMGKTIKDR
ncbi:unnamed protein product, partial [Oppiella nova]